jgi:hypothetical protein
MNALTIPNDVMERALVLAFSAQFATANLEDLEMIDANTAANLLKLTPQGFRLIAKEHHDFGQRRHRWSVKAIRELVEARRVRAARRA